MHPTKEPLIGLIHDARQGQVVLPEFQRSFIWDRQSIEELLVSILNNYFIGSLLFLSVLPDDHPFKARKIEGTDDGIYPTKMVLDGQQRLTSVHYVLYGPDINLKNTSYPYRFFLDIEQAINGNWDEAVFSWPTYWKKTKEYFADADVQYENGILSFASLRDWPTWTEWYDGYRDFHKDRGTFDKKNTERLSTFARRFLTFQVALVELPQGTPLEMVVEVFERINRTGEPLSVFELLTARLWKYDINLRDLWEETRERYVLIDEMAGEKSERYPKFTLQVIALLRGEECKRKNLILLDGDGFREDWETASRFIDKALQRLRSTGEGGYGVVPALSLPYSTMVPPLAVILHAIETEHRGDPDAYAKAHRWYWSSVFSERYGGSTDTLTQRDYLGVRRWIEDDEAIPEAVFTDPTQLQRDLHEVVRVGAVYKGILCLVALKGARDFYTGDTIELHELDDHHIFPKSFLKTQGYESDERNTILNRTLISSDTNRNFIRDKCPSGYIVEMEARHGIGGTRQILQTHFIDEDGYQAMKDDDYLAFLDAREAAITKEIINRCVYPLPS